MNLEEQQPPAPIPPQSQLPIRFSTCDRHPDQNFTSFCASCLRERLTLLEPSLSASGSSTSAARAAGAAIKGIFQRGEKNANRGVGGGLSSNCSVLPELRRSKSFSGGRAEGFSGVLVPQRKSCDVRGRSSLWGLFNAEDDRKVEALGEIEAESRELGFSGVVEPVIESNEEEITEEIEEEVAEEDPRVSIVEGVEEIEVVEEKEVGAEEEKTMKDHIEHDSQNKKPPGRDLKEIAGSFWVAASVFSKKLQKWRRKEKTKKGKGGGDGGSAAMRVEKPYSEIADYGYGRRSIDIDPRYSLDAGRMSFDDPRYSWDAPRASWDGFLTGRAFPRVPPPMISLVEHACVSVPRVDNQIPVEEPRISVHEDAATPGGTVQTRDYYSSESSSSQRRRKSFERSNSMRSKAAAVVAELDDPKLVSNAKVSPTILDPFTGPKLHLTDKDLKNFKSNSHRDDYSESFVSTFRDAASVTGGLERKGSKKSRRWGKAWNIWGLIYKRGGTKDEEDDRYSRGNKVERSLSESWSEFRREPKVEPKGALNRILRSNSSVSSRNSFDMGSSFSTTRKNAAETNGFGKKKEPVLDRNRSARFSSADFDNSRLRYFTPMRSGRRNGLGKNIPKNSHPTANGIPRLY